MRLKTRISKSKIYHFLFTIIKSRDCITAVFYNIFERKIVALFILIYGMLMYQADTLRPGIME